MAERPNAILSGAHGDIVNTDINAAVERIANSKKVVIHFHGGLVSQAAGLCIADELTQVYSDANASAVFFVWQSGLSEVIDRNLGQILREGIFDQILRRVLKLAVGKLSRGGEGRALSGLDLPTDDKIDRELGSRSVDKEPFGDYAVRADVTPLSEHERAALKLELAGDSRLTARLAEVLSNSGTDARGTIGPGTAGTPTLMSPDVLSELQGGTQEGGRGAGAMAFLINRCIEVLGAVLDRFRARTDHGIYTTVVEELLRSFYLAKRRRRSLGRYEDGRLGDVWQRRVASGNPICRPPSRPVGRKLAPASYACGS